MMRYSIEPRDQILVKEYGFLYFAKNMGKNIGKNIRGNLSRKYSQKLLNIIMKYQNIINLLDHAPN